MKPNVGEVSGINYGGPTVDISKFMFICNKSCHTGLGLGMELTDQYWDTGSFDVYKLKLYGLGLGACHLIKDVKQGLAPHIVG